MLDEAVRHDKISLFLADREYTSKYLWQEVKTVVREMESTETILIVDDTVHEKASSQVPFLY